jgi:hypothetical protein
MQMADYCYEITVLSAEGHRKAVFRAKTSNYSFSKEDRRCSFYDLNSDKSVQIYLGEGDTTFCENISVERPLSVEKLGIQPAPMAVK